jgi:N-acetylneuraminic acid mutarotase
MKRSITLLGPALLLASIVTTPAEAHRWVKTGNLTTPRQQHTATLLTDGRVLLVGGLHCTEAEGCIMLSSTNLYDPQRRRWSSAEDTSVARVGHETVLLPNGQVLVAGGDECDREGICNRSASAELFDPASGSWTPTGSLAVPRAGYSLSVLESGQVLAAGGQTCAPDFTQCVVTASAELYDPDSGAWSPAGDMTAPQASHTATVLSDGDVLIAGGFTCDEFGGDCHAVSTTQRYDPDTNMWFAAAELASARFGHTATLLGDGRVLVAGGSAGGNPFGSAELFDPQLGTWSPAASMSFTRNFHTATRLTPNKVLVVGGVGEPDGPFMLDSTEVYFALGDVWRQKATMNVARSSHTATRLLDGTVLVAGGQLSNDSLSDAELFKP